MSTRAKIAAIALAPVAYWLLMTGTDVVRQKPDALETPVLYLAAAWVFYVPVFALAGILPMFIARHLDVSMPTWLGALASGGVAAGLARGVITSSDTAAAVCGLVAAFLGAAFAATEDRASSASHGPENLQQLGEPVTGRHRSTERQANSADDVTSLEGPVERINGKLTLKIPLQDVGDQFIQCARSISQIDDDCLTIVVQDWLAGMLRIEDGDLVTIDNANGKFNIRAVKPRSVH